MFSFFRKSASNFWQKHKKPIFILAPMEDVTDIAFRQMFARYGKDKHKNPVIFTEFISSEAIYHNIDDPKLQAKIKFFKNERPAVAQIFGSDIKKMINAAKYLEKLGYDGIDINMGCPDKSIEKTGSGAAMIKNPELAKDIIRSVKSAIKIPLSVKTRLGYNELNLSWIENVLSCKPNALTIHLRTRKEMSKIDAHWEYMPKIKEMRDKISPNTILIGNGDIKSMQEAEEKIKRFGIDGVMVGRGVFGNPLFFLGKKPDKDTKIRLLKEHLKLFDKYLHGIKSYSIMKKHFKAYINGFEGAHDLRVRLMETHTADEAIDILKHLDN